MSDTKIVVYWCWNELVVCNITNFKMTSITKSQNFKNEERYFAYHLFTGAYKIWALRLGLTRRVDFYLDEFYSWLSIIFFQFFCDLILSIVKRKRAEFAVPWFNIDVTGTSDQKKSIWDGIIDYILGSEKSCSIDWILVWQKFNQPLNEFGSHISLDKRKGSYVLITQVTL